MPKSLSRTGHDVTAHPSSWRRWATRGNVLHSMLSVMFAALLPRYARAEAAPVPERSVDITSSFLNLSFEGIVNTADAGEYCVYRIPALTIRFTRREGLAATAINLDAFRVAVFAAEKPNPKLLEFRYPLVAALTSSENETRAQNIEFTIPKAILRQAEYVALAVAGQPVLTLDGPLAKLPPEDKARVLQGHALWPISAIPNIASENVSPDGEYGRRIYRRPANPDDDCSSVKIR